jgi:hypothetical protein
MPNPDAAGERELVSDLLRRASLLAVEDRVPAYGPHVQGRNNECLDPFNARYNKFGVLV